MVYSIDFILFIFLKIDISSIVLWFYMVSSAI